MKCKIIMLLQYIPWLLLLFCVDAFAALLLWIADAQAFYSLVIVIVLATLLLFLAVCHMLIRLEQKREQRFLKFLDNPDAYHEKLLLETVGLPQRTLIRLLSKLLRERQNEYIRLQMQLSDYEEYVESWAHEAKTPLSLLTLLLDNRREEFPAAVCFKLEYIQNRMQESVDQMLFYMRLKGSRKDYLFEHIQIGKCIDEVLEAYQPLLEEKQFEISFCLPKNTVYSDRRGLQFLLGQIVSNAIKYCGEEPQLRFESDQKDGCYVLCVKDNGIGVRACDLPYIFEKGFTGDSGEGRKQATGMGLYLAKGIAKELNITLGVNTKWGEGFEMQIFFPVVDENIKK